MLRPYNDSHNEKPSTDSESESTYNEELYLLLIFVVFAGIPLHPLPHASTAAPETLTNCEKVDLEIVEVVIVIQENTIQENTIQEN